MITKNKSFHRVEELRSYQLGDRKRQDKTFNRLQSVYLNQIFTLNNVLYVSQNILFILHIFTFLLNYTDRTSCEIFPRNLHKAKRRRI